MGRIAVLYVDAAYCYRRGLSVAVVSLAKTAEPIEMPFGLWTRVDSKNHAFGRGPDPPYEGAMLRGKGAAHCKV